MPENQELKESKKDSNFPRDLLQRFMCGGGGGGGGGGTRFPANPKEETPENVELSLGLSLNGRFGVEPKRLVGNNKLFRASSVTNFLSFPSTADETAPLSLTRTCSLPTETEEEWRKRKELQSLRRSEAKRKRVEKLQNVRVVKGKTGEDWGSNRNEIELWGPELKQSPSPPPPLRPASLLPPPPQFSSQGSIGSQGSGGSSGVFDFESPPFSGPNKDPEAKSSVNNQYAPHRVPANNQYAPHGGPQEPSKISPSHNESKKVEVVIKPTLKNSSVRSSQVINPSRPENSCARSSSLVAASGGRPNDETSKIVSSDMPCVSTKGDGPNGKKVDGFLYRYRKGEVRIVCVCHGSFLTPAEFVKHAGGDDVEHPLRHIIVNPPSFW